MKRRGRTRPFVDLCDLADRNGWRVELTVGPLRDNRRTLARLRVTHGQRLVATAPVTRGPDWAALACLADIAGPV